MGVFFSKIFKSFDQEHSCIVIGLDAGMFNYLTTNKSW